MSSVTGFKQQCPGCGGQITIRNPDLVGKKVDCPKCKYRFVVQESDDAEEAARDKPARGANGAQTKAGAARPKTKGKARDEHGGKDRPLKSKKGKEPNKKGMLIFAGVGVGVLVVVGVIILMSLGGGDNKSKPGPGGGAGNTNGTEEPAKDNSVKGLLAQLEKAREELAQVAKTGNEDDVKKKQEEIQKIEEALFAKLIVENAHEADLALYDIKVRSLEAGTSSVPYKFLASLEGRTDKEELQDKFSAAVAEVGRELAKHQALLNEATNLLPANTQLFLQVPISRFVNSPLGAAFFTQGAFLLNDFQRQLGIPPQFIDQMLISGNKDHSQVLAIVKTSRPFEWPRVREALQVDETKGKQVNGLTYFPGKVGFLSEILEKQMPLASLRTKAAIFPLNATTLVYGDEKSVETMLNNPPKFTKPTLSPPPPPPPPDTPDPNNPGGDTPPMEAGDQAEEPVPPPPPPPPVEREPVEPPPDMPTGATSYANIDKDLRELILRKVGTKPPLLLFAEIANSSGQSPVASLYGFEELRDVDKNSVKMMALSLDLEDKATILKVSVACKDRNAANSLKTEMETILNKSIKDKLKEALGFEFEIVGTETAPKPINPDDPGNPGVPLPPIKPGGEVPGVPIPGTPEGGEIPPVQPKKDMSKIEVNRDELIVTITVRIVDDTKAFMDKQIAPRVVELRAQMDMNTGRMRFAELEPAFHQYLSSKQDRFPLGALDRALPENRYGRDWPADQRVSFMVDLLPYLGDDRYRDLRDAIDPQLSWRDPMNLKAGRVTVPHFLNPQTPVLYTKVKGVDHRMAVTHFLGMAGVGPAAATYDKSDPRAGIFNYRWQASRADIKDGLSNTILMIQGDPDLSGPWIAGGGATVRGASFDGHDIGREFRSPAYKGQEGVFVIMADGSVRFLKKGISADVFKALCTMAGNDGAGINLDDLAPKEHLIAPPKPPVEPAKPPRPGTP